MSETPIRVGSVPGLDGDGDGPVDLFAPPAADETAFESPLDGLRAALAAPPESEPVTLRVPARKGVTIRCHTRMTQEQRKAWQGRARVKSRRRGNDEVDEMLFAQLVIANTCEAILFNGIDAHDSNDRPLTFASRELWDMVGAAEPSNAIRRLFGNDAHVLLASGEILLASGFDDELAEGPTTA